MMSRRASGSRTGAAIMRLPAPFDLVLLLIIAETTQQALLGDDFSLVNAAVLIITLFTIDIALSYVKARSGRLERLLDGAPILLVSHGRPDARVLAGARMSADDVLEAAREKQGLERLDQVRFAVLEASGEISIIPEDR